ncbi:MAG: hypothetical protein KBD01_20080 [Acidobacteria bacterium]|nr:hypothetical protein [Acidobacteriota bacterium]
MAQRAWILAAVALAVLGLAGVALFPGGGPAAGDKLPPVLDVSEPHGDLPAPPTEFSWQRFDGAASYRVTIGDADTVWPLFLRTSVGPRLRIGAAEARAIKPGRVHEWRVEALGLDGEVLAEGLARFRVVPPAGGDRL